eukprot:snap_masked-scaffold_33-processed-gene-2.26-mRNA-1 protein AED:1.00 eAED:1.00 QI:0/-1/0/0/-1/1/1/0/59
MSGIRLKRYTKLSKAFGKPPNCLKEISSTDAGYALGRMKRNSFINCETKRMNRYLFGGK